MTQRYTTGEALRTLTRQLPAAQARPAITAHGAAIELAFTEARDSVTLLCLLKANTASDLPHVDHVLDARMASLRLRFATPRDAIFFAAKVDTARFLARRSGSGIAGPL